MAAVLAGGFYANESGKRLLLWAVAASLTLHLALLYVLPLLQDATRVRAVAPSLTAHLAKPKPPEPAPARIEPPVQPAARPQVEPVAKAVSQPSPVPAPPARFPGVEPAQQAAEPASVVPAAPAAAPAVPSAAARAEPPTASQQVAAAGGPDPGTVARFRLELMDLARRYKRYPRVAQENNWEGRVELRIAIGEDGAISSLTVKQGAGRAVLDDEAQAMIRNAKANATIPPGLRGKAFDLEISVDFLLKDEAR